MTSRARFHLDSAGNVDCVLRRLHVSDAHPERFFYRYLNFCLQLALWQNGKLFVHGAAIIDPLKRHRVLFVGRSGTGKSTIAAAALDAGWQLISDDSIFVSAGIGGRVHALRRPMHLDRRLATQVEKLRCLADLPPYLEGRSKVSFDPRAVFPSQIVDDSPLPTALVFPAITMHSHSRVAPISREDARDGVRQNTFSHDLRSDDELRRETLIASLIDGARALRLESGRDVAETPKRAIALLTEHL